MSTDNYLKRRRRFSGILWEKALPNEYLVEVGRKSIKPTLGGRKLKLFKRYLRIPAYVQKLTFQTDNANVDYQGIGIEGYASWRINPDNPQISIATLDFFDEDAPMANTNEALRTICIEAVRHVIANMSIEQALKNKDEIAENLKNQLHEVENKWGIVFDQVGIERVRIMSDKLFKDLQSDFRTSLHEESEKKRIATQRVIARENNAANEKTRLEELSIDQKIEMQRVENNNRLRESELEEKSKIDAKEREIEAEAYRNKQKFALEKQQKEFELQVLEQELKQKSMELELKVLKLQLETQKLHNEFETKSLEVNKLNRAHQQSFTPEYLQNQFIQKLPDIFSSFTIDNYSVMENGGGQSGLSPVSRIIQELAFVLKDQGLFNSKKKEDK